MEKLNIILFVLLDVFSILVACGSIIEIKGIIAYFIFMVPLVINILFLWKKYGKLFKRLLILFFIVLYLLTGAIFLIRQNNEVVKVVEMKKNGKYIYVTYEINPGAMGQLSYIDKVYYILIDTDLLTVRIVKNSEHYRYRG